MAITTVGAALEFAGYLEKAAESIHRQAVEQVTEGRLKERFEEMAAAGGKRRTALKRLYDDHVYSDMDSGVLAPIASMSEGDFKLALVGRSAATDSQWIEDALACLGLLRRFYSDLSDRLRSGPRIILRRIDRLTGLVSADIAGIEALSAGHD